MVLYKCELCNFESKQKNDYKRHLETKKHKKKIRIMMLKNESVKNNDERAKMSQNEPKMSQNEPKRAKNEPVKNPENPEISRKLNNFPFFNIENSLNCQYCGKSFNTIPNKRRHELHRCKNNVDTYKRLYDKEIKQSKREKEKLYDYIDKLLDKHAEPTTTINIDKQLTLDNSKNQTNIMLNNYGQEDISHISDNMKMNLIKLPYDSVQKMIEHVHFNKTKPENRNIEITNKKERTIKIYKNNKWNYRDRSEIIDDLIHMNYDRLDEYYENVAKNKLSDMHNKRYKKYQYHFDTEEKELIDVIKRDIELLILSANL
jgi:hypothetical protein